MYWKLLVVNSPGIHKRQSFFSHSFLSLFLWQRQFPTISPFNFFFFLEFDFIRFLSKPIKLRYKSLFFRFLRFNNVYCRSSITKYKTCENQEKGIIVLNLELIILDAQDVLYFFRTLILISGSEMFLTFKKPKTLNQKLSHQNYFLNFEGTMTVFFFKLPPRFVTQFCSKNIIYSQTIFIENRF